MNLEALYSLIGFRSSTQKKLPFEDVEKRYDDLIISILKTQLSRDICYIIVDFLHSKAEFITPNFTTLADSSVHITNNGISINVLEDNSPLEINSGDIFCSINKVYRYGIKVHYVCNSFSFGFYGHTNEKMNEYMYEICWDNDGSSCFIQDHSDHSDHFTYEWKTVWINDWIYSGDIVILEIDLVDYWFASYKNKIHSNNKIGFSVPIANDITQWTPFIKCKQIATKDITLCYEIATYQ